MIVPNARCDALPGLYGLVAIREILHVCTQVLKVAAVEPENE